VLSKALNTFLYADETLTKVANLQITNESKEATVLQSPLRKALSPININGNQKHHEASPLTQTPFSATYSTKKGLQKNSTPLEKFSAQSSTLKVHVVVLIPLTKCTL
jgi:kinesin family protein 22